MPTLLITGASRGIGLEFTRQYAAGGWAVIACCRNPMKADKLKALAAVHKNMRIEALDVTDPKAIEALAEKLKGTAIDLLINNAGIFSGSGYTFSSGVKEDKSQDFGSIDGEAWSRVFATNSIAPILVIQAFTPHLAKGQDRKAVNITSKMGSIELMGSGYIAYCTSKAALNAAMRNIAANLKAQNIAVANLHPGWVKTDMGGAGAPVDPEDSVAGLRKVIAGLSLKNTGEFFGYDGKTIPW